MKFLVLFRIFDCSDLASYLLQWNNVQEVCRLSKCCRRLSFLPFRIRFSLHHSVNANRFVHALSSFEKHYDNLVSKIRLDESILYCSPPVAVPFFVDALPIGPSDERECVVAAGAVPQCKPNNFVSQKPIGKTSSKSPGSRLSSLFSWFSSTSFPPPPVPSSSSSISHNALLSPDYSPHRRLCLRSIPLCNFCSVVIQSKKPKKSEESQLTFLRRHLLHFESIRILYIEGHTVFPDNGPRQDCVLSVNELPAKLMELSLKGVSRLNNSDMLPVGIQKLDLGFFFSGPFGLPASVRILSLGEPLLHDLQNAKFRKGDLPQTLEEIYNYSQSSLPGDCILPNSLKILQLSRDFSQKLVIGGLPSELHTLILPFHFQQCIKAELFPSKLHTLIFPSMENDKYISKYDLAKNFVPLSVRVLQLPYYFPDVITKGQLHEGLTALNLGGYERPLEIGILPSTLTTLYLSKNYSHPLKPHVLPKSLRYLAIFSDSFPLVCLSVPGVVPCTLQCLAIKKDKSALSPFVLTSKNPGLLPSNLLELRISITISKKHGHLKNFRRRDAIRKMYPKLKIRLFSQLEFNKKEVEISEIAQ